MTHTNTDFAAFQKLRRINPSKYHNQKTRKAMNITYRDVGLSEFFGIDTDDLTPVTEAEGTMDLPELIPLARFEIPSSSAIAAAMPRQYRQPRTPLDPCPRAAQRTPDRGHRIQRFGKVLRHAGGACREHDENLKTAPSVGYRWVGKR